MSDWKLRLADALDVDLVRLTWIANELRSLADHEVLSAGAARAYGDAIMEAIGEVEDE